MKILYLTLSFLLTIPLPAKDTINLSTEDFYLYREITEMALSPDGSLLAYVVQQPEKATNRYSATIRIYRTKTKEHFQLTASGTRNFAPAWSPDSRFLAFTSTRSGKPQIWLIALDGGDAWSLTNCERGAWSPQWSSDGRSILFSSTVVAPEPIQVLREQGPRRIDPHGAEFAGDVKVIQRLRYRADTEFFDGSFAHIFTIPVIGGLPRQITAGNFDNFSGAWSPDSKTIAFLSNRRGNPDWDDNLDICLVPATGGEIQILTENPGTERAPVWSSDGKQLCWVANTRLNDFTEQLELFISRVPQVQPETLTQNLDRSLLNPAWAPNGESIFAIVGDQGNQHVYEISLKSRQAKLQIGGDRYIQDFKLSPNGKQIYFIASAPGNVSDIFAFNLKNRQETEITKINQSVQRQLSQPEPVWYPSGDGLNIHGWLMRPVDFDAQKKYPLIVQIHGGPYWNYGNRWEFEFQLLCARGYAVFFCNPRVSTGYGQEFATKDHGRWGEGDMADILTGVNHILRHAWIDSTRMGITGGSYGGYLTNWIISHTNRFKAAVTQRSLTHLWSFYGTTDIQNFIEFEFGLPWKNKEELWKRSPIAYTEAIQTPLLILHSELDFRVPISQAEELYLLLKRQGKEVVFVRYPDEGHELSRSGQPIHRVDRLNRIADWFDRHLK